MPARKCPKCGETCPEAHSFCASCGAPLPAPSSKGFELPGPIWWFLDVFPGLVRPKVLIMSVLAILASAPLAWVSVMMVGFGVFITGFLVAGFALLTYATGVLWLLYGYVCWPAEGLSDLEGRKWVIFALLAILPVVAILVAADLLGG